MSGFDLETAPDMARERLDAATAISRGRSDVGLEPGTMRSRPAMDRASVVRLQRAVGNAAVCAYLQREEDPAALQRQGDAARSPVMDVVGKGGGSPLDTTTRAQMEKALGADFSDVRLSVDARSAESVGAAAYTVGNDIVVHPNHFDPGTPSAQRTLAHELTHVKQQRSGPVDGTDVGGGIKVSDPSDRFEQEAEAVADAVTAQRSVFGQSHGSQDHDDHEANHGAVQTLSLQREEEEEE